MHGLSPRRARGRGPLVALAGLGLGFVAGFVVRSLAGDLGPARLRHLVTRLGRSATPPAPPRAAVLRVQEALRQAPDLQTLELDVVLARPGHVELHGWVPSRALGARAIRTATSAAPGIEVTSRLRVRGEDDLGPAPRATAERQPA
jgi:hypothetical protein